MPNILILTVLASFLTLLSGAPASAETLHLGFRSGILMLIDNNLDLGVRRLEPVLIDGRVLSAYGAFDPAVFGSLSRQDITTPLSSRSSVAAGGLRSIESESYNLNAGVTGRTGLGTQYTLEASSSWTADTLSGQEFEYESFTGVSIRQPLLRGYGDSNLLEINLLKKERQISEEALKRALLDAVTLYGEAWWGLMNARLALDVRTESLRLAEALLEASRKRLEAGVISRLELVQAEAAAASRKEDVLIARKAVQARERSLKSLIAGDPYAMAGTEVVPAGDGTLKTSGEGLEASVAKALETRPEYLEARAALERNSIQARYAKNLGYPAVDVEARFGYSGLGESFSDSFSGIDANPQWLVGLAFSYPLGNRFARGSQEVTGIEAMQLKMLLRRIEQDIVLGLDEAIKAIDTDRKRLEAADESVALAEETLAAEERKLEAGRSTTFNVLRIQDDLLQSRLKRLDAVSGYNLTLLRFYREKGTLLEELGINIKDASEVR
ncbi:MAG: TolC family protein [Candidatus Methylomirabilis sp.]|nr:TolC family protein [Deltaproteobacteria bacterium]